MDPHNGHRPRPDTRRDGAGCPSAMDLAAWSSGLLSEEELARIDLHVARCERCVEIVARIDEPVAFGENAAELVDRAASLVVQRAPRLPGARGRRRTRSGGWRWIGAGAGMAAAIGVAWCGLSLGMRLASEQASPAKAAEFTASSQQGSTTDGAAGEDTAFVQALCFGLTQPVETSDGSAVDPLDAFVGGASSADRETVQ